MENQVFEKAKVYELKNSIEYARGSIVSKIIQKNESGTITLFAFDKGQGLSEHTAPFDALVQITEGTAHIKIDSVDHVLNEGDIIIMPANIPHAVACSEKFKMLLTMLRSQ